MLDSMRRRLDGRRAQVQSVRVVVVDGQAFVRVGFRALLEEHGPISVVGEAGGGNEAVALVSGTRPDVVLMDTNLPGDVVHTTRRLLAESDAAVMLLTGHDTDDRIFAALRAGASGLVLKDTDPGELVEAVLALARGETLLSPTLARRLIAELAARPEPNLPSSELASELTAREREVVSLVALGLSNDEIAEWLVVTPATAKTHVSRAMVKLGARDRAQLVVFAYENGLAHLRVEHSEPCAIA
jgi:DNA-binding NarL/FixJ family response regulator